MTVLENVVVGAYVREGSDKAARDVAEEAVARVGLWHAAQLLAGGLSNKQLRLLEIARALAGKPKVLLHDETLAGLGGDDVETVIALLRKLATQGVTIVIIEHTMQAMVRLVHRFIVLNEGSVLAVGQPADITQYPAVVDAYLGKRWRVANA
jgi:branched-chain amino acid transport system permease protein